MGYGVAVASGAEVAGFVGWYSLPTLFGFPLAVTGYMLGSVTAAAMVYHIHTDPAAEASLSRGLKISDTSNRNIMRTMTLGPVT